MRYQFLYNTKESKCYNNCECYYIYDSKNKDYVYDVFNNVGCIHIDRSRRQIYFYGMHVDNHWILEKYYYDIIKEFLTLAEAYDIEGYHIDEYCVGGEIYYKYN